MTKNDPGSLTRVLVISRDLHTCQMCGYMAGDVDPLDPALTVALTVRLVGDDPANDEHLRAVCTNCNEGLQNTAPPKPDRLQLMRQLRRATVADQLYALKWLEQKFKANRPKKSV